MRKYLNKKTQWKKGVSNKCVVVNKKQDIPRPEQWDKNKSTPVE